jgi:hypothetical protein
MSYEFDIGYGTEQVSTNPGFNRYYRYNPGSVTRASMPTAPYPSPPAFGGNAGVGEFAEPPVAPMAGANALNTKIIGMEMEQLRGIVNDLRQKNEVMLILLVVLVTLIFLRGNGGRMMAGPVAAAPAVAPAAVAT